MDWEAFRKAYPKRLGGQRWPRAKLRAESLIKTKQATWEQLVAGAERYRLFVEATKIARTAYVMQAATFLMSAGGWLEDWELPSGSMQLRSEEQVSADDRMRAAVNETRIRNGLAPLT